MWALYFFSGSAHSLPLLLSNYYVLKTVVGRELIFPLALCCSFLSFLYVEVPMATLSPSRVTLKEGENVDLSCNTSGEPAPDLIWSTALVSNYEVCAHARTQAHTHTHTLVQSSTLHVSPHVCRSEHRVRFQCCDCPTCHHWTTTARSAAQPRTLLARRSPPCCWTYFVRSPLDSPEPHYIISIETGIRIISRCRNSFLRQ